MSELDDLKKRSKELQEEMRKNVDKSERENSIDPLMENLILIQEQKNVCEKIVSLMLK